MLVVWARQAQVRFRCTALLPAGISVARLVEGVELAIAPKPRLQGQGGGVGAAAAGGGGGGGQEVWNPRTAGGAKGGPVIANGVVGAVGGLQRQQRGKEQQQQQQQQQQEERVEGKVVSTWLRVVVAGQRHLLTLSDQSNSQIQPEVAAATVDENKPQAVAAVAAVPGALAAVQSWCTTAIWVSPATAADQGLQPGQCVVLHASHSSTSSSSSSSLMNELVVLLLFDDAVAWGHVVVAPPLLLCLTVGEHQFIGLHQVQIQQQRGQQMEQQQAALGQQREGQQQPQEETGAKVLQQQQQEQEQYRIQQQWEQQLLLKSCPSFKLCQILPEGGSTPQQQQLPPLERGHTTASSGKRSAAAAGAVAGGAVEAAAAAALSAAAAAASGASVRSMETTADVGGGGGMGGMGNSSRRAVEMTADPGDGNRSSNTTSSSGSSSRQRTASWGGFLQNAAVKAAGALLGLPDDATAELIGLNPTATAAGGGGDGGLGGGGGQGAVVSQQQNQQQQQLPELDVAPGVVAEAVAAWLRVQLAAVAAAYATNAAAVNGGSSSSSKDASLPLPPALVMHFRVPTAGTPAAAARAGGPLVSAAAAESTGRCVDHMLLLLPQLPEKLPWAIATAAGGGGSARSSSSSSVTWWLPETLLPVLPSTNSALTAAVSDAAAAGAGVAVAASGKSQQGKLQPLTVQYVGVLQLPRAAATAGLTGQDQLTPMLQPHSKYLEHLTGSSSHSSSSSSSSICDSRSQLQVSLVAWGTDNSSSRGTLAVAPAAAVAVAAVLQPEDYPWLQPTLAAAVKRLAPRLDLKRWQAWQGLGLPMAGGVLVSGGTGSGKTAVLRMLGGCLAAAGGGGGGGGAEVLLVSKRGLI